VSSRAPGCSDERSGEQVCPEEEALTQEEAGVSTLGVPSVPRPFNPSRGTDFKMYGSARVRPRCAVNTALTGRDDCRRRPQDLIGYSQSPSISHPPEEQVSLPCCTVAFEYSCSPLVRSRTY